MAFAFHKMVLSSNKWQQRNFGPSVFEAAREAFSEGQRGKNNPMWGKPSPNRGKPSPNKGKKLAPRPWLTGQANPATRKTVRDKISSSLTGLKRGPISEETRAKLKKATAGFRNPNFGNHSDKFKMPVFEYDKNGNFLNFWNSVLEAAREKNVQHRKIFYSIDKPKSVAGSIWRSTKNTPDPLYRVRVFQQNPDGTTKIWNSIKEAASHFGVGSPLLVYYIVKNKIPKKGPIKGILFRYCQ
jgi:hypothetical protein